LRAAGPMNKQDGMAGNWSQILKNNYAARLTSECNLANLYAVHDIVNYIAMHKNYDDVTKNYVLDDKNFVGSIFGAFNIPMTWNDDAKDRLRRMLSADGSKSADCISCIVQNIVAKFNYVDFLTTNFKVLGPMVKNIVHVVCGSNCGK